MLYDGDRYKKDVSEAVERQAELERSKAQLELDWQRRCEDVERLQYAQSEGLVKTLTTARNDVRPHSKPFLLHCVGHKNTPKYFCA